MFLKSESLDDGFKIGLSALLGAIASYIFVQYFEYIKGIERVENRHRSSLHSLDIILNGQLDWLASMTSELKNHVGFVERDIESRTVTFDASASRKPLEISTEIVDAVSNVSLKNKLLLIKMDYEKLESDVASTRASHRYMVESFGNGNVTLDVYLSNMPTHLSKAKIVKQYANKLTQDTKETISAVRVLKKDSRGIGSFVRRNLIEHKEPYDFDERVKQEFMYAKPPNT